MPITIASTKREGEFLTVTLQIDLINVTPFMENVLLYVPVVVKAPVGGENNAPLLAASSKVLLASLAFKIIDELKDDPECPLGK